MKDKATLSLIGYPLPIFRISYRSEVAFRVSFVLYTLSGTQRRARVIADNKSQSLPPYFRIYNSGKVVNHSFSFYQLSISFLSL